METRLVFDYFYGIESEQFSFYRIPRLLVKDQSFSGISNDAKLLYGLMLDRMSLSQKNGWIDSQNRAYIHYTFENIMEDLNCSRTKCSKILSELDSKNGIGLIEKKRVGQGHPDIIYVKNFATVQNNVPGKRINSVEVSNSDFKKYENQTSKNPDFGFQEVQNNYFCNSVNQISESPQNGFQEVSKTDSNYNNISHPNFNYNHRSNQSESKDVIDQNDCNAYMKIIKENIDYDMFMKYGQPEDKPLFDEMYDIICDIVCVKRDTVTIGGIQYPYNLVRSRFLKLNKSHLKYVIDCIFKNTTKINNIRAYIIAALYNAPTTMNNYYQTKVQHDMYG